jgi:hypothetical protein
MATARGRFMLLGWGATAAALALCSGFPLARAGEGWWLLSPEESAGLRAEAAAHGAYRFGRQSAPRSMTPAQPAERAPQTPCTNKGNKPIIEVYQPRMEKPVESPLEINVRFCPGQGASIDSDSVEIKGCVWLVCKDKTKQVKEHAQVSATGIVARGVELPSGQYTVVITIKDDKGRQGQGKFSVEVI